jgi:single-strand selective monofunctional uracil DNA glycosylase
MTLIAISRTLAADVDKLRFAAPIAFVYNPLVYARGPHEAYLKKFSGGQKEGLFVGMNPGPFGMAQTGVPFGDVAMVRDWMGISGAVTKPAREHPKRPVEGFACPRSEVSGTRLWGWARDRFGPPEKFFARFFVWNYCPLCFMETSGRNFTPDKLPARERDALFAVCNEALRGVINLQRPEFVIGVGAFAEERIREAIPESDYTVGKILHPSPASPAANRNWAGAAEKGLKSIGITLD